MAETKSYHVVLELGEDGGFVVHVPAFPGCHTQGSTVEEALSNAREAIELNIECLLEEGRLLPEPDGDLLWVLVTRADDMPGTWIARILDLGLTTQADSLEQAFEMVQDALRLAIVSDVEKGLDPFTRRRAAPEHWDTLEKLVRNPNRSRLGDLSPEQRTRISAVAAQLVVAEG